MAEVFPKTDPLPVEAPDISHIITEDDEPVDNIFSEKQQRLLTETLNGNWHPGRKFTAFANVGIFYGIHQPPVVPDMFLSLDVEVAKDIWEKKNRSYFVWEFEKPPEIVVEIVSNKKGGESGEKMRKYEHIRVLYYVVFDPQKLIQKDEIRVYKLSEGRLIPKIDRFFPHIGLHITLWEGEYEGLHARWLRWVDLEGNLVPTGMERAEKEKGRADKEKERAEKEKGRADKEKERAEKEKERARNAEESAEKERIRAEKMLAMLRAAGMDPDDQSR